QKAIEFLKKDEQFESVALLLNESALIENDPMIRRALLLDAGDIILDIDPKAAARFYYKAFETKNDDRVILSKLLDAYQKSEEWAKSSKVLKKLASLASENTLKGKYLYAMGVIERDKLSDHIAAVRAFDKALDADPTLVKAIQAIDEVITNDKDYERQDRYYRKCLARAINHGIDSRVIFQLAQNLATLNLTKFSNDDAAIQALQVARAHAPKVSEIDKQLLAIYRSKGELNNALDIHYNGLNDAPLKILHYKELFITLRAFGLNESAALVQNTLAALGHAELNQTDPPRDGRAREMPHFTQTMWKMLTPTSMRPIITEVFNLLAPAIIKTYALEDKAYSFSRPEPLGPSTIPSVFMAVASRLRLPLPMVWFSTESAAIAQVHRMTPALVLGPGIDKLSAIEQKFMAARMLFKSKPAFFLATHPSKFQERVSHLRDLFNGCLQLTKTGKFEFKDVPLVRRTLSTLETKDILGLTQMLSDITPISNTDIEDWIRSIDLMASRIGFVLVNEVEAPLRLLRNTSQSCSDLSSSDRLTDLLQFSVSRDYLSICGDLDHRSG
ncbi:MAG: tetratricopeptide repeat protein, partial [Bradymonadia bacterium]